MEFVYLFNVDCDITAPRTIVIPCTRHFSRAEQRGLERTVYGRGRINTVFLAETSVKIAGLREEPCQGFLYLST